MSGLNYYVPFLLSIYKNHCTYNFVRNRKEIKPNMQVAVGDRTTLDINNF